MTHTHKHYTYVPNRVTYIAFPYYSVFSLCIRFDLLEASDIPVPGNGVPGAVRLSVWKHKPGVPFIPIRDGDSVKGKV